MNNIKPTIAASVTTNARPSSGNSRGRSSSHAWRTPMAWPSTALPTTTVNRPERNVCVTRVISASTPNRGSAFSSCVIAWSSCTSGGASASMTGTGLVASSSHRSAT